MPSNVVDILYKGQKRNDRRRDRTCNLLIRSQAPCHWASRPAVVTFSENVRYRASWSGGLTLRGFWNLVGSIYLISIGVIVTYSQYLSFDKNKFSNRVFIASSTSFLTESITRILFGYSRVPQTCRYEFGGKAASEQLVKEGLLNAIGTRTASF